MVMILTSLLSTGCSRSAPADLIDEDLYIDLLVEAHLLSVIHQIYDEPEIHEKARRLVLGNYNISPEQFDRSHRYYSRDVEAQQERLKEARRRLEEEHSSVAGHYFREKERLRESLVESE